MVSNITTSKKKAQTAGDIVKAMRESGVKDMVGAYKKVTSGGGSSSSNNNSITNSILPMVDTQNPLTWNNNKPTDINTGMSMRNDLPTTPTTNTNATSGDVWSPDLGQTPSMNGFEIGTKPQGFTAKEIIDLGGAASLPFGGFGTTGPPMSWIDAKFGKLQNAEKFVPRTAAESLTEAKWTTKALDAEKKYIRAITSASEKGQKIASGNFLEGNVAKSAAGKLNDGIYPTSGYIQGSLNPSVASKAGSYLTSLVKTATKPIVILGLVSTLAYTTIWWAGNEKNDALRELVASQDDYAFVGDTAKVDEIDAIIQETAQIADKVPVIGFWKAETAKTKATIIASEANKAKAKKIMEDAQAKLDEQALWDKRTEEARNYDANKQAIYLQNQQLQNDLEAKRTSEYLKAQEEQNRVIAERDEARRKNDADVRAYWEARDAEQALKDEEEKKYWEEVRKRQEENTKSQLGFGLL